MKSVIFIMALVFVIGTVYPASAGPTVKELIAQIAPFCGSSGYQNREGIMEVFARYEGHMVDHQRLYEVGRNRNGWHTFQAPPPSGKVPLAKSEKGEVLMGYSTQHAAHGEINIKFTIISPINGDRSDQLANLMNIERSALGHIFNDQKAKKVFSDALDDQTIEDTYWTGKYAGNNSQNFRARNIHIKASDVSGEGIGEIADALIKAIANNAKSRARNSMQVADELPSVK